jgi:hypothetical protein
MGRDLKIDLSFLSVISMIISRLKIKNNFFISYMLMQEERSFKIRNMTLALGSLNSGFRTQSLFGG